ncbi:MAG: PEP-CTERM sorting domain-containing protein [Colwellia sp.]|nr:PEP-CTERM sorting domain-containing protein [Colwellia sp.]
MLVKMNDMNTIPEPSIFAIFALGLMGLASRRFKKQS